MGEKYEDLEEWSEAEVEEETYFDDVWSPATCDVSKIFTYESNSSDDEPHKSDESASSNDEEEAYGENDELYKGDETASIDSEQDGPDADGEKSFRVIYTHPTLKINSNMSSENSSQAFLTENENMEDLVADNEGLTWTKGPHSMLKKNSSTDSENWCNNQGVSASTYTSEKVVDAQGAGQALVVEDNIMLHNKEKQQFLDAMKQGATTTGLTADSTRSTFHEIGRNNSFP